MVKKQIELTIRNTCIDSVILENNEYNDLKKLEKDSLQTISEMEKEYKEASILRKSLKQIILTKQSEVEIFTPKSKRVKDRLDKYKFTLVEE